uniref:RING-type E3 ubiquitin transferase n=1 Tax=Elaeophora elaphi TaxID=1147741 RepID=A0A0R3RH88_9BILA
MSRASTFLLTLASVILTSLTVGNAFFQKKQFYPSVVYITKSSPSMAVMYVQGLVVAYMIFQIVRKIFFGELRAAEYEHLSERTWHAIMETCLAFTVFRDDFSPRFVMQFVFLLFIKLFHWLSEDRVDFMERSPIITVLFHCRMMSLLAFLSALDSYFISHAYFTTLVRGASVQIVFGFEYAVLMTVVLHVTIKYILHMHDLRNVHPWENKAVYLLYSELLISVCPINVTKRDNTCIICREEMTPSSGAKKLPCNHIFHANCLRSWFQRQQSCPTCRTDILAQRRTIPTAPAPGGAAAPIAAPAQGRQNVAGIQPANNGGEIPNMFPFVAQFAFPQQPQQQQQQQSQAGTSTASLRNNGGNSVPQMPSPTTGFSMPQFPTTPPGFPFMAIPPFAVPPMFPFPPVPSFVGLTDEEVAAMEGTERAAIEARINCIRNIGLLLDAATMQLQQYMVIVQSLSVPTYAAAATSANTTAPPNDATLPGTPAASSPVAENSVPGSSYHEPVLSDMSVIASTNEAKFDKSPSVSDVTSTAPSCSSASTTELNEIRQRRLQKFDPTTSSLSDNGND